MSATDRHVPESLAGVPRFDPFSPAFYALLLVLLFVPLKFVLVSLGLSQSHFRDYHSSGLAFGLTVSYLFVAAAGFVLLSRIGVRPLYRALLLPFPVELDRVSPNRGRAILGAGAVVAVVYVLYEAVLRSVGLSLVNLGVERLVDVKIAFGRNPMGYVLFKQFADALLLVSVLVFTRSALRGRTGWLPAALPVLAGIHLSTATASRGVLLWMIILPLLVSFHCFRRRLRLVLLVPAFVTVVFLAGMLEIVRQTKEIGALDLRAFAANIELRRIVLLALERRTDSYFPNLFIFLDHQDEFPRRWGADYVSVVTQHIPRRLYADKPVTFIREYNDRLRLQSSGGTGLAPIGEAWVNFGAAGVMAMALLAGAIIAVAHRLYCLAKRDVSVTGLVLILGLFYVLVGRVIISPGLTHNVPDITIRAVQLVAAVWAVYAATLMRFLPAGSPARVQVGSGGAVEQEGEGVRATS